MINFYQILGVTYEATQEDIKRAYRMKTKQYHPDLNRTINANEMMAKINAAYDTLSNPEKRREYDKKITHSNSTYNESNKNSTNLKYDKWLKSYLIKRQKLDELYSFLAKNSDRLYINNLFNDVIDLIDEELKSIVYTEITEPLNLLNYMFDRFSKMLKINSRNHYCIDIKNEDKAMIFLLLTELNFILHESFKIYNPSTIKYYEVLMYITKKQLEILSFEYKVYKDTKFRYKYAKVIEYIFYIDKTLSKYIKGDDFSFNDIDDFFKRR